MRLTAWACAIGLASASIGEAFAAPADAQPRTPQRRSYVLALVGDFDPISYMSGSLQKRVNRSQFIQAVRRELVKDAKAREIIQKYERTLASSEPSETGSQNTVPELSDEKILKDISEWWENESRVRAIFLVWIFGIPQK